MTGAIPNFQASVSGSPLQAAQRKERIRKAVQARTTRSADDSIELSEIEPTDEVELAEPVRGAEDVTSEETKEDHQQHAAGYDAHGGAKPVKRPHIDLEG